MVAHAGFEPAISALRGRCPSPLDECAPCTTLLRPTMSAGPMPLELWLGIVDSNHGLQIQSLPSYR